MDKKSEQHWLPEVCSRLSGRNQGWGSGGGGLEERQVVRSYFAFLLPYCSPICVNFHACKALGHKRTPFLVPVPLPLSLLNLTLFAVLSGC